MHTLSVAVTTPDNYQVDWSEDADFQSIIGNTSTIQVSPPTSTTYYVRVTTGFCTQIFSFSVTIDEPTISDAPDLLQCFEDYLILGVTCMGGTPPYQFSWQLSDGSVYEGTHPQVSPQHSVIYTVTVTDAIGCSDVATGNITVREGTFPETLQAWCNPCEVIAFHETTLYSTDYGYGYTYQWMPDDDLTNPHSPNTTVVPEESATYTITVTDTFGCTRSDTVFLKVNPVVCGTPFVFIPNSFTPNGDGMNDILYVRSDILDEMYFVVYNRWGEKLFETVQQEIGWDGTFKKKDCQTGVYDYYFKGKCKDGDELELKGNVTLIR